MLRVEAPMTRKELMERYARGERDFREVKLSTADLSRADLRGANFSNSKLSSANFSNSKLSSANLSGADLRGADLFAARLTSANVSKADLGDADLTGADLTGADLSKADLVEADLTRVNFGGANLIGANLTRVKLSSAQFDFCHFGDCTVRGSDLGPLTRAHLLHSGPSSVDWQSIVRSVHEPGLKAFLRATGMPDVFVEYMVDCARSLEPNMVFSLLQSTFVSYGGPDEAFARKLNEALERQGVRTFFFRDHAPPGERLHRVMRKGVNEHDRTILICSEASLQRPGLLNELEETLAREAREGGRTYLIPVRLDDYVLNGWKPANEDLAQTVRDRVIADFRNHVDQATFDGEVAKLIAVLKRPMSVR